MNPIRIVGDNNNNHNHVAKGARDISVSLTRHVIGMILIVVLSCPMHKSKVFLLHHVLIYLLVEQYATKTIGV